MPTELHEERLATVAAEVRASGARTLLDLGCGTGELLMRLAPDPQFTRIIGLEIDAAARASGRFIDGPEFRRQWTESGRIFAVARTKDLKELFADPSFRYHLLGQSSAHTLFSNQP